MSRKLLVVTFAVFLWFSPGKAQEITNRHLVVPLADGGFVAFKSETAWTGANKSSKTQELPAAFKSEAFVDGDHLLHRLLVDADGKYVFGYDLAIEADRATKRFKIVVKPLSVEVESRRAGTADAKSARGSLAKISTVKQATDPQILDDGDSFALDLLVNQNTGVKIVDFVKVSFDRANLWNDNPATVPKDFTLDAFALTLVEFRLLRDGYLVAAGKPKSNFGGPLLWCYIEGRGRFIFSLVPRDGYQFQKVGVIDGDRIEFTVNGEHYEWLSSSPILRDGGAWNLWVLHDPSYVPFGLELTQKKEKNRLEKLDDSIKAAQERAAKIGEPTASTFRKETKEGTDAAQSPTKRLRVIVGGADSIENLWPR
jgi:hypothetical protein